MHQHIRLTKPAHGDRYHLDNFDQGCAQLPPPLIPPILISLAELSGCFRSLIFRRGWNRGRTGADGQGRRLDGSSVSQPAATQLSRTPGDQSRRHKLPSACRVQDRKPKDRRRSRTINPTPHTRRQLITLQGLSGFTQAPPRRAPKPPPAVERLLRPRAAFLHPLSSIHVPISSQGASSSRSTARPGSNRVW
jgi:hypothetical protein